MPTAVADVRETPIATPKKVARTLDGRSPLTEDDELLDAPEVYYHPQQPDLSYRVIPGQYPLPRFSNGRTVVYTRLQRETVRRILGSNADAWQGDTSNEEKLCGGCTFASRNHEAFFNHLQFFKHVPR